MERWSRATLVGLLLLHWAAVCPADPCQSQEARCNFLCECKDCSDELDCGYSGSSFRCDFEDPSMCGWTDNSLNAPYRWERLQRGKAFPHSGPASDFTTGTATGWFMGVTAVKTVGFSLALLVSPEMRQSAPTCRLRLRYFLWDSVGTGLGPAPLWASVLRASQSAVVWHPETSSVRGWREDTIFLGRIPDPFRVQIYSERSEGGRGDTAVDHLEFLECGLPVLDKPCPPGTKACARGGCVEQRQLCDGSDDCGDGTDEAGCEAYMRCDFEDGLCGWSLKSFSNLKWRLRSQENISLSDPLQGPGRDHSNNSATGHFLYVTLPDGGLDMDWAAFQSPVLEPTSSSNPCKMTMFTHQFGPRSGGLTVLVADKKIYPVWERGGSLGDVWVKAEVEIITQHHFHILFMAAIRDSSFGGVAVDSISLSPGCRVSLDNSTQASIPDGPGEPCTTPEKICDFQKDCDGGLDEARCGDFHVPGGGRGWTDASVGNLRWSFFRNATSEEEHLEVLEAPGQMKTPAQTRTPLLGPSGPSCSLRFLYLLTEELGELSLRVIDSKSPPQPRLWSARGGGATWKPAHVHVGDRKHRFQLEFEAGVSRLDPSTKIRVKDFQFSDCHANYFPLSATELSCNFEDGPCGWYQDHSDSFDWMPLEGGDHTVGDGRSLGVELWSPALRGNAARMLSFPQRTQRRHCLAFFYQLYGPQAGTLNVKIVDASGYELLLWTASGGGGNAWHQAQCSVTHLHSEFQLALEAVRSGYDGRVAVDDVSFVAGACPAPAACSFEGQPCGYRSSGTHRWIHRDGRGSTGTGTGTGTGPRNDHTLGTPQGWYMLVLVGGSGLPGGSVAVLSSPVHRGTSRTVCVHFWYHMDGVNPGVLTVFKKPVGGQRVKVFSDGRRRGDVWRHGNANISGDLVDWQLELEVEAAGGGASHVAVDDIEISAGPCPGPGSTCTLENGMCTWTNARHLDQDLDLDLLDWQLSSRGAELHYPAPADDHTTGTETGHFLFLPSSNQTAANQKARLLSAPLPPTRGTCLSFWAQRTHSSDSQLTAWILAAGSGGSSRTLLEVTDLDGRWRRLEVNVKSSTEYQVVLEGTRGSAGSLALDDLRLTEGLDCDGRVTDPAAPASSGENVGGLVASILVLVLLLATLLALLVCYLRARERARDAAREPAGGFGNDSYDRDLTVEQLRVV